MASRENEIVLWLINSSNTWGHAKIQTHTHKETPRFQLPKENHSNPRLLSPQKGNIRLFYLILNSILVMLSGAMKASANVIWDPHVLHDFKYLCSFQTEKDPGSNSKLQTWPAGRWEGKIKKASNSMMWVFFLFPLLFSPILVPSLALDGRHCWRQNTELKGTLILLLEAGHAVMTTFCQDLRLHH